MTIFVELGGGLAVLLGTLDSSGQYSNGNSAADRNIYRTPSVRVQLGQISAVTAEGIKFGPPEYEVGLLYLAELATLVMVGAGRLSVDGWIKGRKAGAR